MKNIDSYRKRFYGLLESTMGDVKPLIMEQDGNFSIPPLVINAITEIEKRFSFMSNGVVTGADYPGDSKIDVMRDYVRETIGFDCWNNMSDKLKSQIYSFCFQSDTSVPYKMKFIAGLANAIDSSVNRGSIVNKSLDDSNVKSAISLIKKNCQKINQYYDDYIKIVNQQYKSMDYNDNYKYIWKYRPTAIDRIMNGEDIDNVLNDWDEINKGQNTVSNNVENNKPNEIKGSDLDNFTTNIRSQSVNQSINTDTVKIDINNFKLTYSNGNTKITRLSLAYSPPNSNYCESCIKVEADNPRFMVVAQGKFDGVRTYKLYAILS